MHAVRLSVARGDFNEADKQSRIAERLDRMAHRLAAHGVNLTLVPGEACPLCGEKPRDLSDDGTAFRLNLEDRINRHRLEERRVRDELKKINRKEWDRQYAVARMDAMTLVYESWEGDARLFQHEAQDEQAPTA